MKDFWKTHCFQNKRNKETYLIHLIPQFLRKLRLPRVQIEHVRVQMYIIYLEFRVFAWLVEAWLEYSPALGGGGGGGGGVSQGRTARAPCLFLQIPPPLPPPQEDRLPTFRIHKSIDVNGSFQLSRLFLPHLPPLFSCHFYYFYFFYFSFSRFSCLLFLIGACYPFPCVNLLLISAVKFIYFLLAVASL